MPELTTMPRAAVITGGELIPGLQVDGAVGLLAAQIAQAPRGAMLFARAAYTADLTTTVNTDPGAGHLRWNHASPDSAIEVYLSDVDGDAADHSGLWASLGTGARLYVQRVSAGGVVAQQVWLVTAVDEELGYVRLGVSLLAAHGTFEDEDAVQVSLQAAAAGVADALDVAYDNTASGLPAGNVQDAIDALAEAPAGTGDVVGPASSVANRIAVLDGTTGKLLKDGGKTIADLRAPAIQSVSSASTVTPTFADDMVVITEQAAALSLANPTGTAIPGLGIVIRIKDNGTARAISYGSQYREIGITLPTTTVIGKTTYIAMIYNSADTRWDCLATGTEA